MQLPLNKAAIYNDTKKTLRTMNWNVEGLKTVTNLIPDDFLTPYDAVIFTETLLTTEWSIKDFYVVHSFATKGEMGRPKGGITCLIKPALSPFKIVYKTENIMALKTTLCTLIAAIFPIRLSRR